MSDHHPALEAAIRLDRADPAPYQVYADWLQERGSPFGELIMLEQALARGTDVRSRRRADELLATLELADRGVHDIVWRCGMWERLVLARPTVPPMSNADWHARVRPTPPVQLDPRRVVEVFAMPLCAALDALQIGSLHDYHNGELMPGVLAAAGAHAWAAELPRLVLGDGRLELGFGAFNAGIIGRAISEAFPGLVQLTITSGEQERGVNQFAIEGLELPRLRELAIGVVRFTRPLLAQVYAVRVPNLEVLDLAINNDADVADFMPVLERRCFQKLRALGIHKTSCGDELLARLPDLPIAPQLEALDLSSGLITTRPVRAFARHARAFPRLRAVNIGENYISPGGVEAVRAAFHPCKVLSNRQHSPQSLAQLRRYDAITE